MIQTNTIEKQLDMLKDDPRFDEELTDLELDGINIVSGDQLVTDFKDLVQGISTVETESLDAFKARMNYDAHTIYIWSESVEDAINVNDLTVDTLDYAGISKDLYHELNHLISQH